MRGLSPGTRYGYQIQRSGARLSGKDYFFHTPKVEEPLTSLAFGSCAREDAGSATVWQEMARHNPSAVVLLGDTPYIDSTELARQRQRYREFLAAPEFARLTRNRSLYAIWDDHDFGRNDTNGRLPGKERSRQAFMEYHANPSYGDGQHGIYTRFRRGPVEVFLLDTRYFAATEPSPFASDKPSLLGKAQWKWLKESLKKSTATYKVLACGMIWNKAVRPGKLDHWGTYLHERQELFRFIGKNKIGGVVLVGGDIHRTRVLLHDAPLAGYKIPELITSPVHAGVIATANTPHKALLFDAGAPNSFLLLNADKKKLSVVFRNGQGKTIYQRSFSAASLK